MQASRIIVDSSGKGVSAVMPYLPLGGQEGAPKPPLPERTTGTGAKP